MKKLLTILALIVFINGHSQGVISDLSDMFNDISVKLRSTVYVSPTSNLSNALTQLVPGQRLVLSEGHYTNVNFTISVSGTPIRPIQIVAQGKVIIDVIGRALIRGSDITIEGIEFYTDSWTGDRFLSNQQLDFSIEGARSVVKNCIIHDMSNVGLWSNAPDSHFEGNLVVNIGYGNGSQGHSLYTQNAEGTMIIRNNIFLVNYNSAFALHQYGSGGARGLRGYRYDRNIFYDGRVLMGSPATKISEISFNGNVLIQAMLELGSLGATDPPHEFSLDGNRMWDSRFNIKKAGVLNMTHTMATFPSGQDHGGITNIASGTIDYNRYRFYGNDPYGLYNYNFVYGYGPNALWLIQNGTPFEQHSTQETYFGGVPPNEIDVNVYETTRANVAIANYLGLPSVSVSLTGLDNGDYRALNAQNPKEYFDFTYTGAPVDFTMTGWTNSPPIGTSGGAMVQYDVIFPKFGIFYVTKK